MNKQPTIRHSLFVGFSPSCSILGTGMKFHGDLCIKGIDYGLEGNKYIHLKLDFNAK